MDQATMSPTFRDRLIVKVAIPAVILLTVCNMLMMVHYPRRYTTLIRRSEEWLKTDDYSGKVTAKRKTKDEELFPDIVMQDDDIDQMLKQLNNLTGNEFFPSAYWVMDMFNLTRQLGRSARQKAKTLSGSKAKPKANVTLANWLKFQRNIRQYSLYDPDDPAIDALLHDMANLPIIGTEKNEKGSTFKINLRLSDDGLVIMKPMRYERDLEPSPNTILLDDSERHVAEIASFQLDKILGFYRVPPTVGRRISLAQLEQIAPKSVQRTFFKSPAGNTCFYGHCRHYCDTAHAFCGQPDMIEVAMMSHLPNKGIAKLQETRQPWQINYNIRAKASWETQPEFCARLRRTSPYNKGRILLDIIDFHTFDFLTGNLDRHSYSTFVEFGNFTFPIVYDNGLGFGRKTYDAMSNLAPVRQCCLIRKSTFLKYLKLYKGPEPLSVLMERALVADPVAPVLTRGHLTALDRRVLKILKEVAICLKKLPVNQVIVHDDF